MDLQTAIDRICETENLTDGLEDDEANWLLEWGIRQAEALFSGRSEATAGAESLNSLMAAMRRINRITADRQVMPAEALAEEIRQLSEQFSAAPARAGAAAAAQTEGQDLARRLKDAPPLAALQQLVEWINPGSA